MVVYEIIGRVHEEQGIIERVNVYENLIEKPHTYEKKGKRISKKTMGILLEGDTPNEYKFRVLDKQDILYVRHLIMCQLYRDKQRQYECTKKEIEHLLNHQNISDIPFYHY